MTKRAIVKEKKIKKYNWQRIFSVLGAIIILCSGGFYLFFTDNVVQYTEYVAFPDQTHNNTPAYWVFLSYTTKNEFIVGQPIHIESYILFTDEQSYKDFNPKKKEVDLYIPSASPTKNDASWFEGSMIKISETTDPLKKELQVPFVIEKHLKGTTYVIFRQSGTNEIFTLSSTNGTKIPISNINISPRTVGYELKNNKLNILFALIGIVFSLLGQIKNDK